MPSDLNALVEMLELRFASFKAGNTGVRNEIIDISDELLRQGVLNNVAYKKLMLQLKNVDTN
jgi:histidine ammonia-lyase